MYDILSILFKKGFVMTINCFTFFQTLVTIVWADCEAYEGSLIGVTRLSRRRIYHSIANFMLTREVWLVPRAYRGAEYIIR